MNRVAGFCSRRLFAFFAMAAALAFALVLTGCASPISSDSKQPKADSTAKEYVEIAFHDITFLFPKDRSGGEPTDDSALYTLNRNSKDPGALQVYCSYEPDSENTAKSWYDAFSEFEDCKLVTLHGIEMCIQQEESSNEECDSRRISFAYNGDFYSITVEYKVDSDLGYGEYVRSLYKTIRGANE